MWIASEPQPTRRVLSPHDSPWRNEIAVIPNIKLQAGAGLIPYQACYSTSSPRYHHH